MILVDANLLLYAHDETSPHHREARDWLEATLSNEPDVRLGIATILAYLRLSTDPRVFIQPSTIEAAMADVNAWLARDNVSLALPADGHWTRLATIAAAAKARGPLVMDAHLATLALERGARVATTDRDFARFAGLTLIDPLGG